MGTRSIVAVKDGESWKGRYCHWDGYPRAVGVSLVRIIKRDGFERAIKVLTEDHFGWSAIDDTQHLGMTTEERDPLRFEEVEGYGTAYTSAEHPDEWFRSSDADTAWTEWCYVLEPSGISVYADQSGWTLKGRVNLADGDAEEQMVKTQGSA